MLLLWGKAVIRLDSILKPEILLCQQRSIYPKLWFFQSHVWMWELDYKVSWAPTNWCFWTVVLEKTLESPLDCKEIQHHSSKASVLWHSTFFIVQLSYPYMTTGKTITLSRWTFIDKVMPLCQVNCSKDISIEITINSKLSKPCRNGASLHLLFISR